MGFLKMIIGTVVSFVAFIIAIKILAFILALVGLALGLIKLAIIVAIFAFIAWVVYKLIAPKGTQTPA
jgi:hypothetical protein